MFFAPFVLFCYMSTFSFAVFLENMLKAFKFKVECVQTDNGTEFTNRFTSNRDHPTASNTNSFVPIPLVITVRSNVHTVKIMSTFTQLIPSIR